MIGQSFYFIYIKKTTKVNKYEIKYFQQNVVENSETCLNRTPNKPKSCINRTLNKVLMQDIFVNLTCIN